MSITTVTIFEEEHKYCKECRRCLYEPFYHTDENFDLFNCNKCKKECCVRCACKFQERSDNEYLCNDCYSEEHNL